VSKQSAGYKGSYLEDPDQHYAKITALLDSGMTKTKIHKLHYAEEVSRQGLFKWYNGFAARKVATIETSAQEELAKLKKK